MKDVIAMLEDAARVLVLAHRDPDGDALGATLGLGHLLAARGQECWLYSAGPVPPEYGFLPGRERLRDQLPPRQWPQAAVLLDCHQPERAGAEAGRFLARLEQVAVVDHHQGQTDFGRAVWVDPSCAATSQMLAELARAAGWPLTAEAATCLFVGLQTDTGSFRYSNATPQAFRVAAELVEAGADPWAISQEVYATRPRRLRLLGRVLEDTELMAGGRLALAAVSLAQLQALGCDSRDLEDAVETLRGIPGVEVAALLRELPGGGVKASLRSRGRVDVAAVALALGGGGHKSAAGMRLDMDLTTARRHLAERLRQALDKEAA